MSLGGMAFAADLYRLELARIGATNPSPASSYEFSTEKYRYRILSQYIAHVTFGNNPALDTPKNELHVILLFTLPF